MWDISIALILNLVCFTAIGFGPSLFFLSGKNRVPAALGISPAMGFAITSLIGTYLTLLDYPVSRGCTVMLTVGMAMSLVLTAAAMYSDDLRSFTISHKEAQLVTGAFLLVMALAMAPQLLGGLPFSILRGNGSDSFNYVTVAGYLDHETYSWASHADVSSLVERHPSYERAHELLSGRWTTCMMLAFTSRIGGAAPYKFEYFFSILCFLLAFGPAYLFCRRLLSIQPLLSAAAAAAICSGFWAQVIVDMRADAQLNAIPILLLIAFLVAHAEMEGGEQAWRREWLLVGIAVASLFLLYPEILPMTFLAGGAFFLILAIQRTASAKTLAGLAVSGALALTAVLPTWRLLLTFAENQVRTAAVFKNHWEQAYFPWLYSSPFSGMWGLGPLAAPGAWLRIPAILLGILLTTILFASLGKALSRSAVFPAARLSATFAAAALLQWAYLCARGQLWAGAKGLSFGYPFLMLSVLGYAFPVSATKPEGWHRNWRKLSQVAVFAVVLIQLGFALDRPLLALRGQEYPEYILGHGEYRRHDWNTAPFAAVLDNQPGVTVWSDLSSPWLADYLGLVFGWEVHLVNIGKSRDIEDFNVPTPLGRTPDYIFLERRGFGSGPLSAQNSELKLFKTGGATALITEVHNPNGLEANGDRPFFWLGTKPAQLVVFSSMNGVTLLSGSFAIGPSTAPNLRAIHLTLTSDTVPGTQQFTLEAGERQLPIHIIKGLNNITLQVNDPAIRFLPTDPRPLLVHVDGLHF